jgi:pantoate--beta-alanine ligase
MKPDIVEDPRAWKAYCTALGAEYGSIGFVPTMGALHDGHASLMRRAAAENGAAVASIFVNPTQFNDPKDLEKYPRTLEADLDILEAAGVRAVFLPNRLTMYPDAYSYKITEAPFSTQLCGAHRPGHFDGVLTVVMKLLLLTQARRAYFGEKDFQQLRLIAGMAEAFFLDTEIVPCPIVRENDGLAMSSRNMRLDPEARALAPRIYKTMRSVRDPAAARRTLETLGFEVDYLEDRPELGDGRRLVAAFAGGIRLIDNIALSEVSGFDGDAAGDAGRFEVDDAEKRGTESNSAATRDTPAKAKI